MEQGVFFFEFQLKRTLHITRQSSRRRRDSTTYCSGKLFRFRTTFKCFYILSKLLGYFLHASQKQDSFWGHFVTPHLHMINCSFVDCLLVSHPLQCKSVRMHLCELNWLLRCPCQSNYISISSVIWCVCYAMRRPVIGMKFPLVMLCISLFAFQNISAISFSPKLISNTYVRIYNNNNN